MPFPQRLAPLHLFEFIMGSRTVLVAVIITHLVCLSATAAMPVNPAQGMVWLVRARTVGGVLYPETLSLSRYLASYGPLHFRCVSMLAVGFVSEVYFGLDPGNVTGWSPKSSCSAWIGLTCDSDSSVTAMYAKTKCHATKKQSLCARKACIQRER